MNEIFDGFERDAEFWVALRNSILTSLATLPSVTERPVCAFQFLDQNGSNSAGRIHPAIGAFAQTARASCQSLLKAMSENSWPELTPPEVWSLTIALGEIVKFLDLCFVEVEGRNLTPFQTPPVQNIHLATQWFFFRWWLGPGVEKWLREVSGNEDLFYTHFRKPSS